MNLAPQEGERCKRPAHLVAFVACLVIASLCVITHVVGCHYKDLVLHLSVDVGVLVVHLMIDR